MSAIPYTQENVLKIRAIAQFLLGTCCNLDDVLETEFGDGIACEDVDTELLRELDDITMECQGCGWWEESALLDDEQMCDDCTGSA